MSKKKVMMLGVASAAAITAAMMAKGVMTPAPQPVKVVKQDTVQRTDVLVVAQDVPMGSLIPPSALQWRAWPAQMVEPAMITRNAEPEAIRKFAGRRARAPLFRGEPLMPGKVLDPAGGGLLSSLLPEGMRAVAVKISIETASGGFIQPNDRVDVILTRRINDRTVSNIVLHNVRVMAIDQKALPGRQDEKNKGESGGTIAEANVRTATLAVTEEQAKVLAKVQSMGELSLALRPMAESTAEEGDNPRLSPMFTKNNAGDVKVFRFGVAGSQPVAN